MKNFILILFAVVLLGFVSCKNEADPEADKSFFTKFYDNSNFSAAYIPLDAVQTSDGGYIVLALKKVIDSEGTDVDPATIYLLRTDEFGGLVSDNELDASLGMPAPSLLNVAGKFYFFCMDLGTFSIQLMEVSENGTIAQQLNVGGAYPLAAGVDGTSLLLLSYDPGSRNSVMSVVATDGHVAASKGFTIGAADGPYAPESSILDHALRTGPQLPFFVGKTSGGQYYFNGMYNYTLSVVFTDLNGDNPSGVVQGNRDDGGVSALYSLNGGKFAASRFNYGDNYLLPASVFPNSGVSSSADLGGNAFPELTPNAPVKIVSATINGNERILYGSNTRGKQIALFGYNPSDGSLIGSKYIGFSNSFELASVVPTNDDGLLVLGTTYIAGRFPRICLFKLSSEALGKSFQ